MNIEKAIEILSDSIADNTLLITLENDQAVKLGIEALKEVDALRKVLKGLGNSLLPGETERR